jgi:hypothetical protein
MLELQQEDPLMRNHNKLWLSAVFFTAISLTCFWQAARAQLYSHIKFDPQHVSWTELSYQLNTFSADVNVQVQMEFLSAAEVVPALIKSPQGTPIDAWVPDPGRITIHYRVDSIFKPPVRTLNQVWFNPMDATALGRIRQRRGNEDFKKIYRFTQQGVFRHQREPKDQQELLQQPDQWTSVKDTFYAYDRAHLGCPNVTERLVLIYVVSAAELSDSMQPLSFCGFGRRQLFHLLLKPEGFQSLKVDFIEKKQQKEIRRQGEIKALKITLEAQPLASDLKEVEDFSFLGFQEDITMFVDPRTHIPIQLSGRIPMAGKVDIKLNEVQLK